MGDKGLLSVTGVGYREAVYAKYASAHVPGWLAPEARSDAVWARAAMRRLRGWLPENRNAKCLDLGCGAGHLLKALREAGYRDVRGVDISPEARAIAHSKGLDVTESDLRDYLRQSREVFDLICAFDVIEHFGKDEILDVFRLVWQGLKPGGVFILQTPNALSPWAAHLRYGDLTHELIFSPQCLASTLRLTGFGAVEIREAAPYVHGIKSAARRLLWEFIRLGCALWNLAETGSALGGVYSRNMMVRAVKQGSSQW